MSGKIKNDGEITIGHIVLFGAIIIFIVWLIKQFKKSKTQDVRGKNNE